MAALTSVHRAHLEHRLLEEREAVLRALATYARDMRETVREESGDVATFHGHMADLGTDTADQEFDLANAARLTEELGEIDAALERLYRKPTAYGECEGAGEPIPFERLDVLPWTRTCRDHAA